MSHNSAQTANATAAPVLGRRRTALADQSNKVNNVLAIGGKQAGSKPIGKDEIVKSAAVKATIAASRPRTRSSISKNDVDSTDSIMEATDDNTQEIKAGRPIRSLRASTVAANAAASSSSAPLGKLAAVAVPRGRPSNIPRTSFTNTSNVGSTKNVGLRPGVRNAAAAPVVASTSAAAATTDKVITRKQSTKNVGLVRAAKREIQEVTLDQTEWVDDEDVKPGHRVERRRSKRLRASDPDDPLVDQSGGLSGSIAGKVLDETDDPLQEDVDVESEIAKDYGWVDLDVGDEEDPLMCSEYVKEIHEYMQQIEVSQHVLGKPLC